MRQDQFFKEMQFIQSGGFLKPYNEKAVEHIDGLKEKEVVTHKDTTPRDLKYHLGYMALIHYCYDWLPNVFKDKCIKVNFIDYLKMRQGFYTEIKVGKVTWYKLKSIAFGNMSQKRYEDYCRTQIEFFYSNILQPLYTHEEFENIFDNIEHEFETILKRL